MATMTITIPDSELSRVVEALCVTQGVGPVNPANGRLAVVSWMKRTVLEYDRSKANNAAVAAVAPPSDPGLT
jgi:hypothetical protein